MNGRLGQRKLKKLRIRGNEVKMNTKLTKILMKPSIRYSKVVNFLRQFITYEPKEGLVRRVIYGAYENGINGDYLEFGVWEGRSFIYAYNFAKSKMPMMNYYAFDSFEGLQKPKGIDKHSFFKKGKYFCPLDKFKKNLEWGGVDEDKVTIIKGFYDNMLTTELKEKLKIKRASVVWIDCDLYESTKTVLNFIISYLVDGTIIVFHDWYCFNCDEERGERLAVKEWLKENPSISLSQHMFNNIFVVKVRT